MTYGVNYCMVDLSMLLLYKGILLGFGKKMIKDDTDIFSK